ncbi:putativebinding protein [Phaeomoniella chlamydospora]|uniref:Putativebinding protein n=1 Tax=Phaeomoniella chlamydospora TaxID=158046 RepID=A0A0G2DTQ1_PHACM|nr:putativebinding protein [Phaeomoniella chlamydospora]
MQFSFAFVAAVLPFLASAAPTLVPRDESSTPYTVTSLRSGSAIQYSTLVASGTHFYLGSSNSTAVLGTDNNLNVAVPGGQQIYLETTGALRYTVPHSGAIPSDAAANPIIYTASEQGSSSVFTGSISTSSPGSTGLIACPVSGYNPAGAYQVYANTDDLAAPSGNNEDCLSFEAVTLAYNGTTAWEY